MSADPKPLTAHFTPFYLLFNARRICAREWQRSPNWVLLARGVLRAALAVSDLLERYSRAVEWTPSERASMTCHCGDCKAFVRGGFKS